MAMDRADARRAVGDALEKVASFQALSEAFEFTRFRRFHEVVFLSALRANVRATIRNADSHYDIELNEDDFDAWPTVGHCIDWVVANAFLKRRKSRQLRETELRGGT